MQYGWFLIYYAVVAVLGLWYGSGFIRQPEGFSRYLVRSAEGHRPPRLLLKVLRYTLIFSLISVLLSFYPFAAAELVFSTLMLGLVFASGRVLLLWDQLRVRLVERPESLQRLSVKMGWILVGAAVAAAVLWVRLLARQGTLP